MNEASKHPPSQQSLEQFAVALRTRAEEAMSASVHHASISQQYLTLAQKYSALAEQASSGQNVSRRLAQQLDAEASHGTPAPPQGWAQTADAAHPSDGLRPPAVFHSPPARVSLEPVVPTTDLNRAELSAAETTETADAWKGRTVDDSATAADPDSSDMENRETQNSMGLPPNDPVRREIRPRRKSSLSIRGLVERCRRTALERAERVRIRSRKADLHPKPRSLTEDMREEWKLGRRPAAVSTLALLLAMIVLTLVRLEIVEDLPLPPIVASFSESLNAAEASISIEPPAMDVGEQMEEPTPEPEEITPEESEPQETAEPEPSPETATDTTESSMPEESEPLSIETPDGTPAAQEATGANANTSTAELRSEAGRQVALAKYGGSAGSESAVGYALAWLASRQRANGSWDFNDAGPCSHPGTVNNPIGGTAYALLPFLTAGHTHRDGEYRRTVQAGIEFLISAGIRTPAGFDLRGVLNKADKDEEPGYAYYVQGAATLALCEAYGMTKDRRLRQYAEEAARFLVNSQDPKGGGWRYSPQQPGSTSATAIQIMALKSAEKSGIRIPDSTWKNASLYLDSVAVDGQGRYGYEIQKKSYTVAVTSMAMLSRMYLGWGRDDGDLRPGIELIDKRGPYDNLYYNYFATQVMKHWGGPEWERWNSRLRDDLIAWQEQSGDAKGSWTPRDRDHYSRSGGRLLTTCLAALTLEVYYRNQPLISD